MTGRREQGGLSARSRVTAGGAALALAGTALAIALLPAGSADAKTPSANYHAGSDKAVFTVTGVEDSNCLVSTGGETVFIKPGDRIDFSSALAGISLNGLDLQGGQVAGLDVHAKVDGGANKGGETLSVPAGKTVKLKGLTTGTHKLSWSAKSVSVAVPALTKTITGLLGSRVRGASAATLDNPIERANFASARSGVIGRVRSASALGLVLRSSIHATLEPTAVAIALAARRPPEP